MRKIGNYTSWRKSLDETTPAERRIGDDFLLIEDFRISPAMYEPFTLDTVMAVDCLEGSLSLNINMVNYRVEAPGSVTLLVGQIVQFLPSGSGEVQAKEPKLRAIVMSERFATDLFRGNNSQSLYNKMYRNPVTKFGSEEIEEYNDCFMLLGKILSRTENPYRLEAVTHLSLTFFYGYSFPYFEEFTPKVESRQEQVFKQFIDLLAQNYRKERTVGFYADRICLTPKYLSQIVSDVSGKTAYDWIEDYVVNECKALLKSTDMSVGEISDRMNFSSQAVFGKFFRNATGLSPREYRTKMI